MKKLCCRAPDNFQVQRVITPYFWKWWVLAYFLCMVKGLWFWGKYRQVFQIIPLSTADIIDFTYVTRLFMSRNTQFQYKQTFLYSVDTLYILLRLGNIQTLSFKNRKLLWVCNACCFCVFFYIHYLNNGRR
jgi:hypothetical protein